MYKSKRCVVTGLGLICAVGNNVKECWVNASEGRSGIRAVKSVDTEGCETDKGAEVPLSSKEISKEDYDRSSILCIKAAEEALKNSRVIITPHASERMGVIIGSCVGGAASIDKYYSAKAKGENPDVSNIYKMSASAIANNVAAHFGINGRTANIVNACAAGTMSLICACDLIRAGKADLFIAGGTDSFSSLAFGGFNALHALSPEECSPFNRSDGITLGEGAGILIVESYEHAVKRGAKIYCEISGGGISSDAYHITAPRPDGEGQINAITRALENSGLDFEDIDYINAHGTGTSKNDEAEFLSLHKLFDGNDHLSVSSTKSMTGHCLGAAGSIEAVLAVNALCENTAPPTIGFSEKDLSVLKEKAGRLDFVANVKKEKELNYVMSNSFAFGGNNASVIFSKKTCNIKDNYKHRRIFITGIGEFCGEITPENPGAYCDLSPEVFKSYGIKTAFYRKLDRFGKLMLIGGIKALKDAGITVDSDNENKIGISIGTADGPLTEITGFQKNIAEKGTSSGSAFTFPNTVYNAAGGYFSIFTGIKGYSVTVANGFQSGIQSIHCAVDVLRNGTEDIMLAIGADEKSEEIEELYKKTGVIGNSKIYSLSENGFVLGEGCVTIVLEGLGSAEKRSSFKYAEIAGCAVTHKAVEYNKIKGTETALKRAVLEACAEAGIAPKAIDAVCGFGSGCKDTDEIELNAYRELYIKGIPIFCVKEKTGEARAASGCMQVSFAAKVLAGKTEKNIKAYYVTPDKITEKTIDISGFRYILAVSFGGGGTYSAVIVKKTEDNFE